MEHLTEAIGGPLSLWILAGTYFSLLLGERVFYAVLRRGQYDDPDALCSVGMNLLNSALGLAFAFLLPLAVAQWLFENVRILAVQPVLAGLGIAFLCHELAYYWEHRLGHRVGLFWAFHAIHHSSNAFNHSVAARGFFLDGKLQVFGAFAAALLGVPPVVYVAVATLKSAYGIWNHASWVGDLGWLDKVFVTPRNHMVHHANQPQYIDRNYGQVLLVWDRLFGTYAAYEEPPVVGLVKPVHDNNPLTAQFVGIRQLVDRMRTAERWRDRLAYLWKPPEWSHDGVCRSDCPKYAAALPAH